ncbi:MAG: hypothetical protein NT134_02360, partial [Chloroflexi bacterium]|nr:hypothetical protein [Chloroflexota bacterium]
MKKLIIGLALVVLLLVPAACAGEAQEGGGSYSDSGYPAPTEGGGGDKSYVSGAMPPTTTDVERMIVRTGDM